MMNSLRADLRATVTWASGVTDLDKNSGDARNRTPRVHQSPLELPIYNSRISSTRPIRMLEIGTYYGDSLQTWRRSLHPGSVIVGVDPDSRIAKIADSEGTHVRFGDGQRVDFLTEVAAEFGPFDMIVDVASQTTHRMADTFGCLFGKAISENGTYVVEDVYCDIWSLYNGFALRDIFRALIDAARGHYQIATHISKFRSGHVIRAGRMGTVVGNLR